MWSAAVLLSLLWATATSNRQAGIREDSVLATEANASARDCEPQVICIASANQEAAHDAGYWELFEGCLKANPETKVVALALQDFAGGVVPPYVGGEEKPLPGLPDDRFKLRHELMLTNQVGEGHFCYGHWAGGAWASAIAGTIVGAKVGLLFKGVGAIPGALIGMLGGAITGHVASTSLGANCGGVSLFLYSRRKVDVGFDVKEGDFRTDADGQTADDTEVTATTMKGTVAAVFKVNGRPIVLASTHAAEGIRAKDASACPLAPDASEADVKNSAKLVEKERKRVRGFRSALGKINTLRKGAASDGGDGAVGVLWGGDFNPRSADPTTGCPIWPTPGDGAASLERLKRGRDVLGESPDTPGVVATFTSELAGTGLAEVHGKVECPTYKKQKASPDGVVHGFSCKDDTSGAEMFYKPSHPPSWTDRLFSSAATTEWLECGPLQRVVHQSDHDAVLAACVVRGPDC